MVSNSSTGLLHVFKPTSQGSPPTMKKSLKVRSHSLGQAADVFEDFALGNKKIERTPVPAFFLPGNVTITNQDEFDRYLDSALSLLDYQA